jgi:hypothetical protein
MIGLGSRVTTAVKDVTGNNSGNWTATFDPAAININVPYFECHHIVITGGAAGASFTVYIDLKQWDANNYAVVNAWDPNQPMNLIPGNSVYFYFSDAITDNSPATITMWFRYDPSIPANSKVQLS